MKKVVIVSPHPDDETLGCGGTLLKHRDQGDRLYWVIVTNVKEEYGFSRKQISTRMAEIEKVTEAYGFEEVCDLCLGPASLDRVPKKDLIHDIGSFFKKVSPQVIYTPFRGDVHSDHKAVFDAVASCSKWFRYGSIKKILACEILSETEFGLDPVSNGFVPNYFVNIDSFLEKKIDIMKIFKSEESSFPFPRSEEAIRALAKLRGATAGCGSAEAFMLLREIV